jgi:hypothetical protein
MRRVLLALAYINGFAWSGMLVAAVAMGAAYPGADFALPLLVSTTLGLAVSVCLIVGASPPKRGRA